MEEYETTDNQRVVAVRESVALGQAKLERQRQSRLNVLARQYAREDGAATYQGTPCQKEGHGRTRKTRNGVCVECNREQNREYRARQKAELTRLREMERLGKVAGVECDGV